LAIIVATHVPDQSVAESFAAMRILESIAATMELTRLITVAGLAGNVARLIAVIVPSKFVLADCAFQYEVLKVKKGDIFAAGAQPIAKGIDWIFGTDIQGCSGCKGMQNNLNQGMSLADAVIARWFSSKQQTGVKPMGKPYVINEQTVIEDASSPADALAKKAAGEGEIISMTAQVRPQPANQQQGTAPQPQRILPVQNR
jgi:hypothetical protein